MSKLTPTILDAMADPALFGRQFEGESWDAWRAYLATLFGLPLEGEALYWLAWSAGEKGLHGDAVRLYERILGEFPDHALAGNATGPAGQAHHRTRLELLAACGACCCGDRFVSFFALSASAS